MSITATPTQPVAPRRQGGVALLEALVAILIFSIGILGLIGLQAVSTQSTTIAKSRIDASFVASQRIAEMWGDIANINSYVETDADVSAWLPSGKRTTTVTGAVAPYQVTVTVTWRMPSEIADQSYTTVAMVTTGVTTAPVVP